MPRRLALGAALAVMCAAPLRGNEVIWTASGTVSGVLGGAFTSLATTGDPVALELRYDDGAPREPAGITDIPGVFMHWEYRENVDLDLKATIGASTWRGTLASGSPGQPHTIELQDFKVGPGTEDFFKVRVAAEDGAAFPSFPGTPGGARNELTLEFRSALSTTAAEPDYLGSIQLKCAAQSAVRITRASGFIGSSTGSGISFTIDPGSIATEVTGLRGLDLTGVEFNVDEVTLRWKAEVGKSYIIQHLDEFLCWARSHAGTARLR
jgi:hypothetical protein